jgi:hypothetical protein
MCALASGAKNRALARLACATLRWRLASARCKGSTVAYWPDISMSRGEIAFAAAIGVTAS